MRLTTFAKCSIVFVLLNAVQSLSAQSERMGESRTDAQAIAVLERVLAAMGGKQQIVTLTSSVVEGKEIFQPGWGPRAAITWKNSGDQYRYETTRDGITEIYVSGHNKPASVVEGKVQRLYGHVSIADVPSHLAALLLLDRLNSRKRFISSKPVLEMRESVDENGKQLLRVRSEDDMDSSIARYTAQEWLFDPSTSLPYAVEYYLPDHNDAAKLYRFKDMFSDFREVSGVLVPFHIERVLEDKLVCSIQLTSARFNVGISDSDFDAPEAQ